MATQIPPAATRTPTATDTARRSTPPAPSAGGDEHRRRPRPAGRWWIAAGLALGLVVAVVATTLVTGDVTGDTAPEADVMYDSGHRPLDPLAPAPTTEPAGSDEVDAAGLHDARIAQLVAARAAQRALAADAARWSGQANALSSRSPLYSRAELETIRLAREGRIPKESIQSDTYRMKRLINEGQVPRA
jgi:hypothetical protein